jgi:hypothetical protein
LKWLASNPEIGERAIPAVAAVRKVRWSRSDQASVVEYVSSTSCVWLPGEVWLLLVYSKSVRDNIPGSLLKAVLEEIENG